MCTVLLRFLPGTGWPLLLAAIRDEFVERDWDPPARHWDPPADVLLGGRDRRAGGTWLAVDPVAPAATALLNGVFLPPPGTGARPSRGRLPLAVLCQPTEGVSGILPDAPPGVPDLAGYDGFHLLRATPRRAQVWTWDGLRPSHLDLAPGDHILTNLGVDHPGEPLVQYFTPLLRALPTPDPAPGASTGEAWGGWVRLLAGAGLAPDDPRALIVRRQVRGRGYGSTSASLVALGGAGVRYDFATRPGPDARWWQVPLG